MCTSTSEFDKSSTSLKVSARYLYGYGIVDMQASENIYSPVSYVLIY